MSEGMRLTCAAQAFGRASVSCWGAGWVLPVVEVGRQRPTSDSSLDGRKEASGQEHSLAPATCTQAGGHNGGGGLPWCPCVDDEDLYS